MTKVDADLKSENIPVPGRAVHAVMKIGVLLKISLPIGKPPQGSPKELIDNWPISEAIFSWVERRYGDAQKFDPNTNRQVAVLAHGDIWQLQIPIVFGVFSVTADRAINKKKDAFTIRKASQIPMNLNAPDYLFQITQERAKAFSKKDLNEIYGLFVVGFEVFDTFKKFGDSDALFFESLSDLSVAVMHVCSQSPNYGQSRYASMQVVEKFMKGFAKVALDRNFSPKEFRNFSHDLSKVHDAIAAEVRGMNLMNLLADIQCSSAVRYGEEGSTKHQAYQAHKSSLLLIRTLGAVRYSQSTS